MLKEIFEGGLGMLNQNTRMEVTANNIANANTSSEDSEARMIWKTKWIDLANKDAETEVTNCTDIAIAKQKHINSPCNSDASNAWEIRWIKLSGATEYRLEVINCTEIAVAEKKYFDAPSKSIIKTKWLNKWMELSNTKANAISTNCTDVLIAEK